MYVREKYLPTPAVHAAQAAIITSEKLNVDSRKGDANTLKERRKIAHFLNDLTRKKQTRRVKTILDGYNLKYRKKIIILKVNRRPLLFEAAFVGNIKLVTYLIEECGANVEQTGYYEITKCTSLWVAAARNFLNIVDSLLKHGANVNSCSCSQRTVVSIACHSVKMVRYLMKHGADIHTPDSKGRTCLMYSVHSTTICQLLLSHGAQVNQIDNKGKDALHFAIRKGPMEAVKLLVENGADILRIGSKQNTPLELSVIECKPVLVEYLLATNRYTSESTANAYELLGTKVRKDDSTLAKCYWAKALEIRNRYNLFPKKVPHQSVEISLGIEFRTVDELNEISINLESMWSQALLIQLRVLGPKHPETCNSFSEKILHHFSRSELEPAIELLECLFRFYATHLDPLSDTLLLTVRMLMVLVITLIETNNYDIKHAHNLTCLITRYLSMVGMDFLDSLDPTERQRKSTDVQNYLIQILSQIDYTLSFNLTEEQHSLINVNLYKLIRRQPQGPGQVGLLHLTIRLQLSPKLLAKLIECGANIDWQDGLGNTAVHYAIHRHLCDQQLGTLTCLLDHGCHVDLPNNSGYCPLEYLRHNGILNEPLNHYTLQCMAAKAIKKYQILYTNIVPRDVGYFTDLH